MTDPTFVAVTEGTGDTPATDMRLSSVPEIVAFLGWHVLEALTDKRTESYCYQDTDDEGFSVLRIGVDCYNVRPRMLWLLRHAGLLALATTQEDTSPVVSHWHCRTCRHEYVTDAPCGTCGGLVRPGRLT